MAATIYPGRSATGQNNPAAEYFALVRARFEEAAGHGVEDKFFQIGGHKLRLRLAGDAPTRVIFPALTHLIDRPAGRPALTLSLADMATTKTALDFPGGEFNASDPTGAMWRFEDARHFVLAQKETEAVSLIDLTASEAFYWTRDASRLPWMENTFPLRYLLTHFFRRHGQQLIHSAAVGDEHGAVLIVGKGGSGKSTATLACATHGLYYLGDDYTLAGVDPEPRVWSLYGSAKVNADTLNWFPALQACVHHAGGITEKSSLFLNQAPGVRLAASRPIRAVLWPKITGRAETRLVPARPSTLLVALAPSSILQTPGDGATVLQMLSRLVQTVPTFILEAGNDPAGIASAIKKFLAA